MSDWSPKSGDRADVIYEAIGDDDCYRIRPNPDAPPGEGYSNGALIEHRPNIKGYEYEYATMIDPTALGQVADAFVRIMKDTDRK